MRVGAAGADPAPVWPGRWVQERLGVDAVDAVDALDTVHTVDTADTGPHPDGAVGLELRDLVGLAVRRNPRRVHLLVSTVLGKHIPTDPRIVEAAGRLLGGYAARALGGRVTGVDRARSDLAAAVRDDPSDPPRTSDRGGPWVHLDHAPVVLGYAETATALGHCVARVLGAPYLHSTRRRDTGVAPSGDFAEEHSHAVEHLLVPSDPAFLAGPAPLVLVDDELSTGRTARNTIAALQAHSPRRHYVIAALVDLRDDADDTALRALARRLDVRIDVVSLARGRVRTPPDIQASGEELMGAVPDGDDGESPRPAAWSAPVIRVAPDWPLDVPTGARHGISAAQTNALDAACGAAAAALEHAGVPTAGRVLVLGTEELMYAPLQIAGQLARTSPKLDVRFSSTTRSPVVAIDASGYAIRTALRFPDPESAPPGRPNLGNETAPRYAYNVAGRKWDAIVVITDARADTAAAATGLLAAVGEQAGATYLMVLPDRPAPSPPGPEALRGPAFGSYAPDDVGWLLRDLSDFELEAPTEDREESIQSGAAHYAASLPIEFQPGAEYEALFDAALQRSADRVATAVGVVTQLVLRERGADAVLASLARAGTPIGVLMRRWARHVHDIDLPHYTLSIVRGRGVDEVALRYLAAHHDPRAVVFVDGWTGKGAIVRELAAAVRTFNATSGLRQFDADPVVLADPGSCVRTFGTRDDFLIPSACLNSTVSGLVSRTVLNDLIGPGDFHGAKYYADLAAADRSGLFIDTITARFAAVGDAVQAAVATLADADRTPTWTGWAAVESLSARYDIGDVNLVKPGVGETTRVLLRRVPWRVLVRPERRAELAHVELLATRRGVPVEEVPDLAYSCVGLIHPRFTRGATGSDGRAAR